jgi:hypothetical protein
MIYTAPHRKSLEVVRRRKKINLAEKRTRNMVFRFEERRYGWVKQLAVSDHVQNDMSESAAIVLSDREAGSRH